MRDAKERGDAYYDQTSEHKIVSWETVSAEIAEQTLAESNAGLWMKPLRRVAIWSDAEAGAELGRLLLLSRLVDFAAFSCLCSETSGVRMFLFALTVRCDRCSVALRETCTGTTWWCEQSLGVF